MARPPPSAFDAVAYDSQEACPCSPRFERLAPEVKGLKLNAPAQVTAVFDPSEERPTLDGRTRFPVCLTLQLPSLETVGLLELRADIELIATDTRTGEEFSSHLGERHRGARPGPRNPNARRNLEGAAERHHFNVNLTDYVQLPARVATWAVHATFGAYTADAQEVEVQGDFPPPAQPPAPRCGLGLEVTALGLESAADLGLPPVSGVLVLSAVPGTPAGAGFRSMDVLTHVAGVQVRAPEAVAQVVEALAPGATVVVTVVRGGGVPRRMKVVLCNLDAFPEVEEVSSTAVFV